MMYALIVIYNKACSNSSSIKDIRNYAPNCTLIIYDNSTKDFNNKSFCKKNGYIYFTQHKNVGISKAYNFVLDHVSFNKHDYLIMLDDDTHLTQQYINEAKKKVRLNKYDVILPIVKANKKIISPYNYFMKCRSKIVDNPDDLILSKVSGINSGMIIHTRLFKNVRYNEKLFLDYVDYDFMRRVHVAKGNINIMDSEINQEFQYFNYDKTDIQSALSRFRIDMHDYKILCDEVNENWFFYIHAIKFMLKQTIRYRSFRFLSAFFEFCL